MENLTADERKKITQVLERDVQLQRQEEQRVLFAKLAVTVYDNEWRDKAKRLACKKTYDQSLLTDGLLARNCARCGVRLGYLSNTGDQCACCQERICPKCVKVVPSKNGGIIKTCQLCHLNRELKAISGTWLSEQENGTARVNQPSTVLLSQLKKIDSSRSPSSPNPASPRNTPRKKPPPKLRKFKRNQTLDTIPNQLLQKPNQRTQETERDLKKMTEKAEAKLQKKVMRITARRSSEPKSLAEALTPNKLEVEDKVKSLRKLTDVHLDQPATIGLTHKFSKSSSSGSRESVEYRSNGSLCPLRESSIEEPTIESNNNLVAKKFGPRPPRAPPLDPIALMREEEERDRREEMANRMPDIGGLIGKLNIADTSRRMSAPAEHIIAQLRGTNGKRMSIARLLPYN